MDIDKMEAGRELDVLVAEKVMGYKHDEAGNLLPPGFVGSPWNALVNSGAPQYSDDIAAAWEVVEKLSGLKLGWFSLEQFGEKGQGKWRALIWSGDDEVADYFTGDATTVPLAICRAALKATMSE